MAICSRCGKEFNVTSAKRTVGRMIAKGLYNEYYPDGDICEDCALEEIGADYEAGADALELAELSGYEYD